MSSQQLLFPDLPDPDQPNKDVKRNAGFFTKPNQPAKPSETSSSKTKSPNTSTPLTENDSAPTQAAKSNASTTPEAPAPSSAPTETPPPAAKTKRTPKLPDQFTVTQATRFIKQTLLSNLPGKLTVTGEISNLRQPASGHIYFDLKDANAILPAVMWRSSAARLKFNVSDGQAVIAVGAIDLYEPQGKYQLSVTKLEPAGVGALELAFRQLADKLRSEGLFNPEHKKPIPRFPRTLAIVTSGTGAAIKDIHQTLRRRFPIVRQLLYPVAVQGENAPREIARAINYFNEHHQTLGPIDAMIVGRGGGSLEDLWAFNEEIVARAIYASQIPVITGIGHEIDTTIADYVADQRAVTPTAAAELAVPVLDDLLLNLTNTRHHLHRLTTQRLENNRQQLRRLTACPLFQRPSDIVHHRQQKLDHLQTQLSHNLIQSLRHYQHALNQRQTAIQQIEPHRAWAASQRRLLQAQHQLEQALQTTQRDRQTHLRRRQDQLIAHNPIRQCKELHQRIDWQQHRLERAMTMLLQQTQKQLQNTQRQLHNLDPRAILQRGYSITRRQTDHTIIHNDNLPQPGEIIMTELANGKNITSTVTSTTPNPQETPPANKTKP